MAFPKLNLDGIKSKLGMGDASNNDDYDDYEDDYDRGYDDYDDYDDYDNGRNYDLDDPDPREPRPYAKPSYDASLADSAYSSRAGVTRPRLVSIDDVNATTHLDTDPKSSDSRSGSYGNNSRYSSYQKNAGTGKSYSVDSVASSVGATADLPEWRPRSEGLDSLFSPTTGDSASSTSFSASPLTAEKPAFSGTSASSAATTSFAPVASAASASAAAQNYDPYETYATGSAAGYAPQRSLSVIKPVSYNDVAKVAKTLRSGDVVVLALRNTPDGLSKRILDFSFGVASALDAHVDCVGDKVFAVYCGAALSDVETARLRSQGVL